MYLQLRYNAKYGTAYNSYSMAAACSSHVLQVQYFRTIMEYLETWLKETAEAVTDERYNRTLEEFFNHEEEQQEQEYDDIDYWVELYQDLQYIQ